MKVNFDLGFRGVARSLRKDICIFAPGSCMPACQANSVCRSRNETFTEEEASERAMAIARDAGPKPMQMRSWIEIVGLEIAMFEELGLVSIYGTWIRA